MRIRLPPPLREGEAWAVGLLPGGYLALAGDSSQLFVLDRALALETSIPLPGGGAGNWVLARERGLLARSIEGEGITLYRWDGAGWADPVEIADTANLAVIDLRQSGDRVDVVCRHHSTGKLIRLGVSDTSATRRSVLAEEARAFAATTRTADAEWTIWSGVRDRVLTRRPIRSGDSEVANRPAGDPPSER